MKRLKCWAWHCAVWLTWFFKEEYHGHGHYSSPFKDVCAIILFTPLVIIFFPVWGPIAAIWWICHKIRVFAEGPSPCPPRD